MSIRGGLCGLTAIAVVALSGIAFGQEKSFDLNARPDLRSVKSVKARIKALENYAAKLEKLKVFGIVPSDLRKAKKKADWLGSYLYYIEERAWPNDTIDPDLLRKAMRQASILTPKRPKFDPNQPFVRGEDTPEDYPNGDWTFLGPRNLDVPQSQYFGSRPIIGRVSGIAVSHQDPNIFYVTSGVGGVFKTIDGGDTWTSLMDNYPFHSIGAIAVSPTNDDVVYVGLGDYDADSIYTGGIMRSTNGGASWTNYGAADFGDTCVSDIEVDPDNAAEVYVSCGRGPNPNSGGVYRSSNSGVSWTQEQFAEMSDLDFSIRIGSTRYLWAVGPGRAYRSTDGMAWNSMYFNSDSAPMAVACSKYAQQTVYLLRTAGNSILKTTDNGTNWPSVTNNFPHGSSSYNWSQDDYDFFIGTVPNPDANEHVIVGLIDVVQSINGGASWSSIGGPTYDSSNSVCHNDQHVFANIPGSNISFLFGNDGGLYRGVYVSPLSRYGIGNSYNDNLPITQFYSFNAHPSITTRMLGGSQDNATPTAVGDLNNWSNKGGGDGSGAAISQTTPDYQYTASQYNGLNYSDNDFTMNIDRTVNAWATAGEMSYTVPSAEPRLFVPPMMVNSSASPALYTATDHLYRFQETGAIVVVTRFAQTFSERVRSIAIAPSNSSVLYVGTLDGTIYRSATGGTSWIEFGTGLPDAPITCISVHPTDPDSIVVTLTGTGLTSYVWRCLDTAVASPTWGNRGGDAGSNPLPDVYSNWIERDPWTPTGTWYCATDIGVFYTDDSGANWFEMSESYGLPNVGVRRLHAVAGTTRLYAATWGRGAYRMIIGNSRPQLTSVSYLTNPVVGGFGAILQMNFDMVTPPDGFDVTLSHSPGGVVTGQTTAHVYGGRTNQLILVNTNVVGNSTTLTTTVTSPFGGQFADSTLVQSHELTGLTLNPTTVQGSHNSTGTVFLNHDAPPGGLVVSLTSLNTAVATVPSTVTVPSGSQTAQFTVASKSVNTTTTVAIRASFSGTLQTETLTVTPINLNGHTITPSSITGGDNFNGTVSIAFAAGPQGVPINMSSNNPNAQVPATVTVPNGQTTVNYVGTSSLVSPSTVTASITANKGTSFYSDTVALQPVQVSSITFLRNPTLPGRPTTMYVNLSRPIPASGLSVSLSSDSPKWLIMPASAVYFVGQSTIPVTITPRSTGPGAPPSRITITATHMSSSKKATLVIQGR